MKLIKPLTVGLVSLNLALRALAQPAEQPAAPVAPAAPALTEAQLTEEFGWWVAKRVGLSELEFSPGETEALLKGFSGGLRGQEAPYELQKAGPAMDALMQRKQAASSAKLKTRNASQTTDFFAKLQENKAVVQTPSGLRYEILAPGNGPFPKPTETVTVNYTGTLIDGTVFDSSVKNGSPAQFPLDGVIAGWTEGLQKIGKGGKMKLYVPPQLGYGDDGRPGIPPGSTLIFDIELLDIKATAAAAAPPAPAPATVPTP